MLHKFIGGRKKCTESSVSHGAPYSGGVSVMEAGRVNIKDFPRPGQANVVINSAAISVADELTRQNRRITTLEIAVELSNAANELCIT
ncbi:hypothetical protein AVEN_198124-1 [Araneus ventricosus]|uniref:Uncharacterized protein n=1 Tax=Araneus ventricosus TaxID=182803 RepID=A0A4Y2U4N4_ARAVE|nr:hypothetical protein AVEN_46705-1 [Araneus ventricosus]GBO07788.1 hypothetical protein AVEN_198124-1 [Araneus ventricosus]